MSEDSPVKYFICGGVGGIFSVMTGHPMDTIKVRLQTLPVPKPGESPLYSGTWDCCKKTVAREGFLGLYKGSFVNLTSIVPIFAVSFFSFCVGKQLLQTDPDKELNNLQIFLAGAFSGVFTTSIMAPGERIKCLLQVQQCGISPNKYKGMVDCAKQLHREGGIKSVFRGSSATLLRNVPASGIYFLTYEWLKAKLTEKSSGGITLFASIVAGGSAGVANWMITMPADVLKSRLQTAPEGTYPNGLRDVFKELMRKEGPTALYKGVVPVMLRAFPANAACFLGFDLTSNFLDRFAPDL